MIDQLITEIKRKNAPVVVGLDPMLSYVPGALKNKILSQTGETLEGAAEVIWEYNRAIIDAISELIPAVKPQIAMYEQYGPAGLALYERTIRYCQEKGLLVIGDIKRGDIGSTSSAYAAAHLGRVQVGQKVFRPFHADAVTVNPYMGSDAVEPFRRVCKEEGTGIFVLVKTSNPSSGEFQDRLLDPKQRKTSMEEETEKGRASQTDEAADGKRITVYEAVGQMVNTWGLDLMGKSGYSEVGAVVGATYPEIGARLRRMMPRSYILVPGYGAQGAGAKELGVFFNEDGLGAIVNSSRGIICAWQKEAYRHFGEENFAAASRAAVMDMIHELRMVLENK